MRYVMMTFPSRAHSDWWEQASGDERRREIEAIEAWFREHAARGRIKGGAELGFARDAKTIRRHLVTDGPFLETKEGIGGFIVIEAPDEATAIEIAQGWPSLAWDEDAVELRPEGASSADESRATGARTDSGRDPATAARSGSRARGSGPPASHRPRRARTARP
jgi:hypothetical protein